MLIFLKQTIREAGYMAKGFYERGVGHTYKSSPSDFLTEADLAVNDFLISKIREKYPDHGIHSEEREEINPGAEYQWVIDPIDGTRNFAKHIAVWCVMVGLTKNGVPIMGAIYDAMNDELYFAERGKGAYLNGNRIRASDTKEFDHCFMVFSCGAKSYTPWYAKYYGFFSKIMESTDIWLHNYGSILPVCHLAAGRIDAMVSNAGLYHDYLAGYVIATEAGAKFTNSSGKDWTRDDRDVVVANPELHGEIIAMFT